MFNVEIGILLSARFLYMFFQHLSSIYLFPMQNFRICTKNECLAWCNFVTRHNNMPFLSRFYLKVALGKACTNEQFSFILSMTLLSRKEPYLNTSISYENTVFIIKMYYCLDIYRHNSSNGNALSELINSFHFFSLVDSIVFWKTFMI